MISSCESVKEDFDLEKNIQEMIEKIRRCGNSDIDAYLDKLKELDSNDILYSGMGEGYGDNRVLDAVKDCIDQNIPEQKIHDATDIILYMTGDVGLMDSYDATEYFKSVIQPHTNIISGCSYDGSMADRCEAYVILY